MARPFKCTFQEVLPVLKKYNVGAFNWGLVAGKSQTHCPWDSWEMKYEAEPPVWFHDIFRQNGEPFDREEVQFLKETTRQKIRKRYNKVA
jgi:hypothetical protein